MENGKRTTPIVVCWLEECDFVISLHIGLRLARVRSTFHCAEHAQELHSRASNWARKAVAFA